MLSDIKYFMLERIASERRGPFVCVAAIRAPFHCLIVSNRKEECYEEVKV